MPSAIRPVPHRESLPIPEPPNYFSLDCDDEEENTPEEHRSSLLQEIRNFPEHNLCWTTQDHAEINRWLYQRFRAVEE